jgi:PAS domain S-box-containing protein
MTTDLPTDDEPTQGADNSGPFSDPSPPPEDLLFPPDDAIPVGATLPVLSASEPPRPRPRFLFTLPDTGGRYHVECEVARGAMGSVFKARDAAFGREVALKLLLDEHLDKPEFRRRFAEEARITAHLHHPGVVPVYEAGEFPGGRPFFSMRFVRGDTLEKLLAARTDAIPDRSRFLKVFEKLCETLAYAHAQGVIHRDLKPANVMVADYGRVKVMDWGVAKALPRSPLYVPPTDPHPVVDMAPPAAGDPNTLTQFGRVLGTPSFMAPEQARGHADRLDERTDVFGLGAILCMILTGQPPYHGPDARATYRRAVRADLTDALTRLDECEAYPELIALCRRCLAPAPADRPRDARVLYQELSEHLDYDLRRAERDLVRFFELSPDLFCIAGVEGYFHRVNANFARILGYPTEELLARPFIDFVHPDDRERTLRVLADLAHGFPCVHFRNRYRDVYGADRWLEWAAKPIAEEGVIFAVARDVTDQVRLESRVHYFEQD